MNRLIFKWIHYFDENVILCHALCVGTDILRRAKCWNIFQSNNLVIRRKFWRHLLILVKKNVTQYCFRSSVFFNCYHELAKHLQETMDSQIKICIEGAIVFQLGAEFCWKQWDSITRRIINFVLLDMFKYYVQLLLLTSAIFGVFFMENRTIYT